MVSNAELVFWCVCGVIAVLAVCALPFFYNYLEYQEVKRMFDER